MYLLVTLLVVDVVVRNSIVPTSSMIAGSSRNKQKKAMTMTPHHNDSNKESRP